MPSSPPAGPLPPIPPELFEINNGPKLMWILSVMSVVVTIVVGLRVFVRLSRRIRLGIDDWLIIVALRCPYRILNWGLYAIAIMCVTLGGLGKPVAVNMSIDLNRLVIDQKLLFAGELVYPAVITITKFSILAMYRRIFPTRFMKIGGVWILGGMSAAWWLAIILVVVFQCNPQHKIFDPFMLEGKCIDLTAFFLGNSIPNILLDVAILCLPVHEVWHLHLPKSQRLALAGVFLVGAGVVVSSVVRLHFHVLLARQGIEADFTMAMFDSILWTVIEPDMAIICASLPALRPLLTGLLEMPIFGGSGGATRGSTQPHLSSNYFKNKARRLGGSKPESGLSGGSRGITVTTVSDTGSFHRLHSERGENNSNDGGDIEISGLWPDGYRAGAPRPEVSAGGVNGVNERDGGGGNRDDVPLGSINVRTEVDWRAERRAETSAV